MIYELLEKLTGAWGRPLLDFYLAHNLVINLGVLLYGLLLWFSWRNLQQIRHDLLAAMLRQMQAAPQAHLQLSPAALVKKVSIPWEQAVAQARFPLVAQQWALWPQRRSVTAVQSLLPPEELAATSLARLAAAQDPPPAQATEKQSG